jgi:hypothetical protein
MIKIQKKELNENSNDLLKIFDMISITKNYNIVGSYSIQGVFFPSDIDLNEIIIIKNKNEISKIIKNLKNIILKIKNNINIFFTDFKIGIDHKNEGIHWSIKDIQKGKKVLDNRTIKYFDDSLLEGTVKLDILYRISYGMFYEISIIYLINPKKINIISELKSDIKEYLHIDRSFKALKRCFSLYTIENNQKKLYKLIKLFNSDISLIAKVISEVSIYIMLLELYPKRIPLDEIHFAIQNDIKYYLSCIFRIKLKNKLFKKLDEICNLKNIEKTIDELNKLNDYFKTLLQDQTKIWISFNKGILPK